MVAVRQKAHTSHTVKVAVHPIAYAHPLVIFHVDGDADVVLGPLGLEHQVMLQLLQCAAVIAENRVTWALHREAEDVSAAWFDHAVLHREALLAHQLSQGILLVSPNSTDVVLGVPWMDTRSAVHQLTDRTGRFDRGDGHRLVDAQLGSPFLVGLDGGAFHCPQPNACCQVGLAQDRMVHDASQGHTQQAFFFLVLLPDAAHVTEVREHRLVSASDGGNPNLLAQRFQGVILADDHFGQVADTGTAQGDLGTRVNPYNLGGVTATTVSSFLDGSHPVEDATFT